MNFLADENNVRVMGRTLYIDKVRYLNYSASAIEFEFTGKKVEATLWTNGSEEEEAFRAWIAVYINDKLSKRFSLDKVESTYLLYESKKTEEVKVRIVKLSEASFSMVGIKSIYIDSLEGPKKTKPKLRKFEFIGDSITCGYGIEGKIDEDDFTTAKENVMLTYGVKTAQYFNADFNLISYSSKGVITASIDKEIDDRPSTDWLMPMVYKYTDIGLSRDFQIEKPDLWNSKKFPPDIIVINLGTNDATYTRDIEERIKSFGEGYYKFLKYIRKHNQESRIICTLGVMGQELCGEIKRQVEIFKAENDDHKVYFMAFDVQKEEDGIGTHNHPSARTHEKMAEKLIKFINEMH